MTINKLQKLTDWMKQALSNGEITLEDLNDLSSVIETFKFFNSTEIPSIGELMGDKRLAEFEPVLDENGLEETHGYKAYVCPYCGSSTYVKNGHDHRGNQKYKCKDCGHAFKPSSQSIFAEAKLTINQIIEMLGYFIDGLPYRQVAQLMGINKNTAFYWRHKISDCLLARMDVQQLSNYVEADETYFEKSFKGLKSTVLGLLFPRTRQVEVNGVIQTIPYAYHRGSKGQKANDSKYGFKNKRGLSSDKVCVACGVDNQHYSFGHIVSDGNCSGEDIIRGFEEHIMDGSILCTDGKSAYKEIVSMKKLIWKKFSDKCRTNGKGMGIQHINNYHMRVKDFINNNFRGVSTKYLPNYIAWFNFSEYHKAYKQHKIVHLLDILTKAPIQHTRKKIVDRPIIPYV